MLGRVYTRKNVFKNIFLLKKDDLLYLDVEYVKNSQNSLVNHIPYIQTVGLEDVQFILPKLLFFSDMDVVRRWINDSEDSIIFKTIMVTS